MTKKCTKCGEIRSFAEFTRDTRHLDGLKSECKDCHNATSRTWRTANPEPNRESNRVYRAANPAQARAATRKWSAANPENVVARSQRRRARRLGNGIFVVTAKEIAAMLAKPCYICGTAPSVHVDHIIALSRGGRHAIGNLAGACASCNRSKYTMFLVEFQRHQRRLAA